MEYSKKFLGMPIITQRAAVLELEMSIYSLMRTFRTDNLDLVGLNSKSSALSETSVCSLQS